MLVTMLSYKPCISLTRNLVLAVIVLGACCSVRAAVGDYTHEWAVQIEGGDEEANAIATEQNYDLVDKVSYVSSTIR